MSFLNIFSLLRKSLFIYQQEVYETPKLLSFFYSSRILGKTEKRQSIDWTLKAKALYALTLFLFFISFFSLSLQFWWSNNFLFFLIKTITIYGIGLLTLPLFLITSQVILSPLDAYLKKQKIKKAKQALLNHKKHLKIIGITGSFGKSTAKEFLTSLLSEKFSVICSPANKNTPLGFAEFVNNIHISHEILIVEMGAYHKGDIQEMCDIVQPDYGVLTGINEQHLERFGDIQATLETKNELSSVIPANGKLWVNGMNALAKNSAPQYVECPIEFYDNQNIQEISYTETGGQKIAFKGGEVIESPFLADYFPILADLAFKVGKEFTLTSQQVQRSLEKIHPTEHRLYPHYHKNTDILIIDDSYNGNPDGALAAIKTLGRFQKKHKIYLTPGLVELGEKTKEIHENIGKNLAFNTDEVWLIQTSVTPFILEGLKKSKFPQKNIRIFSSAQKAHTACKTDLKQGTVILLQNDWTDNYA